MQCRVSWKKKKKNLSKNLLLNPINSLSLPMFRAVGRISRNIRERLQRQYVYFVIESWSLGRWNKYIRLKYSRYIHTHRVWPPWISRMCTALIHPSCETKCAREEERISRVRGMRSTANQTCESINLGPIRMEIKKERLIINNEKDRVKQKKCLFLDRVSYCTAYSTVRNIHMIKQIFPNFTILLPKDSFYSDFLHKLRIFNE